MKQDLFTTNTIDIDTNGGYSYEQIMNNKNCSKNPKYWFLIEKTSLTETPKYLFKSSVAESWEFWDKDIVNPVRNSNLIYLRFLDVSEFMKPSSTFKKEKRYCNFAPDSIGWNKYWDDLEDKIDNGFEVGGVRITGRHFFLINFGRFRAIPTDENGNQTNKKKIWTFLRFLDHQYYMMMELEECLLEGPYSNWDKFKSWFPIRSHSHYDTLTLDNFALAKGRRKGWTAQIAIGIFNYNFTFLESSMNILAAYEKSHYGAMLKAIHTTKSFLDANTPWIRRTEIKGTYENFKASVEIVKEDGRRIEEGYLSEITAASFKDNSFKTIGESASVINLEEAGRFPNILEAYQVSVEPLIRDGETSVGISIVGGTAGDMESGGSYGLSEIIYKPEAYGFKSYNNIYEPQNTPGKAGWFIDDMWYLPVKVLKSEILSIDDSDKTKELLNKFNDDYIDCVDKQGNSYRYFAELIIDKKRNEKKKISSIAYQKFITQQPKYLSEAFLLDTHSPFDTVLAKEVLGELSVSDIGEEKGTFTILPSGKVEFKLNMRLVAIDEYPYKGDDTTGCWVVYERPQLINGEIPYWRYIAGSDPIDWGSDEVSADGVHSNASAFILDTVTRNIVAEYIAKPKTAEDYFEQLWRGLEYFNALLLYENNLKSLFSYFKLKNKLYLLSREPELLRNRLGYKSNGRIYGFHATPASNSTGRDFINTWTLEQVQVGQTEDGDPIFLPRMYFIKSKGLLQEIISWNSKGNFDRISSLGALMLLLFDRNYDNLNDNEKEDNSILQSGVFKTIRDRIERRSMKYKFKNYINGN